MKDITNLKYHDKGIITFTKEVTWLPTIETGWGNGYIGLPIDHPFASMDMYDTLPEIEGQEWTYQNRVTIEDKEYHVFGFDSGHYGQTKLNWPEARVVTTIENYVPIALAAYNK